MLGLGLGTSRGGFVDALAEVTNTKSILFDGGDEYIDLGTDLESWLEGDDKTLSVWIQNGGNTSEARVFNVGYADAASTGFALGVDAGTDNKPFYFLRDTSAGALKVEFGDVMAVGSWHHFAIVQDTSENEAYIYQNGVLKTTVSNVGVVSQSTNHNAKIGKFWNASDANYFNGNVDEFALWTSALTAAEITQIYNSNRATLDLSTDTFDYSSSANLKMWLRMGDEASTRVVDTNANNLVIPDMRKTFFSGKSIDFDGSNDYIEVSDSNNLSFGDGSSDSAFSISAWIYMDDATDFQILNKGVFNTDGEWNFRTNSSDKLVFALYDESVASTHESVLSSALTSYEGQWIHVVGTYDGTGGTSANSGLELYINGSNATDTRSGGGTYVAMENLAGNVRIGRLDTNYGNGKICDVAVWNTELDANTVASIYNSGEPNNLLLSASYTAGSGVDKTANLQAYYRMGNGTLDLDSTTGDLVIADQTNATLGSELFNGTDKGVNLFTSTGGGTEVSFEYSSGEWIATGNGGDSIAIFYLSDKSSNGGLSSDLDANSFYKVTFDAKEENGGVALQVIANNSHTIHLETTYTSYTLYIKTKSTSTDTNHYIRFISLGNTEKGYIKNLSVKKLQGNAGVMENMSAFDIVDHAPNRNSGDMINFDATADIETDTPVQIYTVTNTKSVLFDGSDDFIQFGDIEFTGAFSISAWIKFNNLNQETLIGNSTNSNWLRFEDTDDIKFKIGNNSIIVTNSGAFSTGSWFHFSAVRNSSNVITFYKNGVALSTTGSRSGTFTPERIGQKTSGDTFFDGNIDELALWNVELSASQVAQIYHGSQANFDLSQNGGGYTSASNLQAWWRMGDGTIDDFTLIGDQTDTSLQSNIIDSTKFFREEDGTSGGWTPYGTNSLSVTSDSVTIAYGNHTYGAKLIFKQTGANSSLTENLVVDQVYKFSCTISSLTDGGNMRLNVTGASVTSEVLSNGDAVIYFRASHATSNTLRLNGLNSGETVTISNPSLQKVNGNAGIMTSMTSSQIETDTP